MSSAGTASTAGQNGSDRAPSAAIHQAKSALSVLAISAEAEKLEAALYQLCKVAQVQDCFDVLVHYGSCGAVHSILNVFENCQNNPSVLVAACHTLKAFVCNCDELRVQAESREAYKVMLAVAVRHPADVFVQEAMLSCLAIMAELSGPGESSLRAKLRGQKILPQLMSTLSTYNLDVAVQEYICRILAACLTSSSGTPSLDSEELDIECVSALDWLLRSGEYRRICNTVVSHGGKRDIQLHACRVLMRLSNHPVLRPRLVMEGLHEHILRSMKDIPTEEFQITACALLSRLALIDDWDAHGRIITSGALSTVLKVAKKHSGCAQIQQCACVLLERLGKVALHSDHDISGWLPLIRQMMSDHTLLGSVQAAACRALSRLLSVDQGIQDEIGDLGEEIMSERKTSTSEERDQLYKRKRPRGSSDAFQLHHQVVITLNLHGSLNRDAVMAEEACRCLYWMCEDNARIRRLLLQKGAHSTIVTCLKRHGDHVGLNEWGLRALRELARGAERCYNDVYNSSAHDVALRALSTFPMNHAVVHEAIALLSCLSLVKTSIVGPDSMSVHSTQYGQVAALKFCDDGFLPDIMKALCNHESQMSLVEVAFEAISIVLDLLPTQRQELMELNAVDVILQCMSNYVEVQGIQKKGFMLLRYLSSEELFCDEDEERDAVDGGVVVGLPNDVWANQAMLDFPLLVETNAGASPAIKRFLAHLDRRKTAGEPRMAAPPPPPASASKPSSESSLDDSLDVPLRSNADRCIEVACLVTVALQNFLDDDVLLCEACAVIKELAEFGDKIKSCFVEQSAHRQLFEVLRRDQLTKTVLDHVCSAVHVLCSSVLKNRMLLQGVEDRDMVVVQFLLQNGADVNCIDKFNNITPLSWAARNDDDVMVRMLLRYDISDYRSPLREALDIRSNSIISKILGAIVNDQHLPGVASLSGYELEGLCSAWLSQVMSPSLPSLPPSRRQSVFMDGTELKAQRWLIGCQAASRRSSLTGADSRPTSPTGKRRPNIAAAPVSVFGTPSVSIAEEQSPMLKRPAADSLMDSQGVRMNLFSAAINSGPSDVQPSLSGGLLLDRPPVGGFVSPSIYSTNQAAGEGAQVRPLDRRVIVDLPQPLAGEDLQSPLTQVAPRLIRSHSPTLSGSAYLPYVTRTSPPLVSVSSEAMDHLPSPTSRAGTVSALPHVQHQLLRSKTKSSTFVSSPQTMHKSIVSGPDTASSRVAPARNVSSLAYASDSDIQAATSKALRSPRLPVVRSSPFFSQSSAFITELDVSDNRIPSLSGLLDSPSITDSFSHLLFLNISHNKLSSFPMELARHLVGLRHLQMSYNSMMVFPPSLFQLQQLERLGLSHNQISSLEYFTRSLIRTQTMLSSAPDDDASKDFTPQTSPLNASFYDESSVLELENQQHRLPAIPLAEPLNDLTELHLSENFLEVLPADFSAAFPFLKQLLLNDNRLSRLPVGALQFNRLTKLDLCGNRITELTDDLFYGCTSLESLKADNNEISSLPSGECAETLESLVHLSLANNKLARPAMDYLPGFILQLPRLRYLDISHNELTGLPSPSLWQSKGLRSVVAANNSIRALHLGEHPGSCWGVIDRLDLQNNLLAEIPGNIGDLDTLSSFNVDGNDGIQVLPASFGKLKKLWEFPRHKLPNLELDAALKNARTREIVNYMEDRFHNSAPYYRIRMLVVGRAGQGKTSLVRYITGNLAIGSEAAAGGGGALDTLSSPAKTLNRRRAGPSASGSAGGPAQSVATVGVSVNDWKCYRRVRGKQLPYTISCWDFAGQEEYYSTHQCFLSSRSLYLAVYNMMDERAIEKLRPWLLNIQARAPGCPVLAVGTHMDQVDPAQSQQLIAKLKNRLDRMRGKAGMPKIVRHEFVDASKKNQSIAALRVSIFKAIEDAKTASGQPILGGLVPAVYLALEDRIVQEAKRLRLENSAYPIIHERRMRQLAHEITSKDYGAEKLTKEKMAQAVCFLHEAGVLLHYDDAQSHLSDLYFLDPEWLCSMMAKIVTHKEVNGFLRDGIMERSQVDHLFGEERKRLPTKFIPQYLRLLERFEIVLSHEKDGKPYLLIPSLLPTKRQVSACPGFGPRRIIRHYQMPYIPLGFMARLIARLYLFADSMLDTKPVKAIWRSGVHMLWHHQAYCIVEVTGKDENRLEASTGGFNFDCTTDTIVIEVTCNPSGRQLLGYLADNFDTLVEEWYSGLSECDLQGNALIRSYAVCPDCAEVPIDPSSGEVMDSYRFPLDDLVVQSEGSTTAECPFHCSPVPIRDLAPDIMLGDLPDSLILDPDKLQFDAQSAHRLGKGGFGDVFRWTYAGRAVAVKVFKSRGGDSTSSPNRLLRQEVQVMRHLQHPSVIDLVGVQLQPRYLIMELAPQGSLRSILERQEPLFRPVQHRIALQVAEGLEFLHRKRILYRDLKSDNVLIFSTNATATINAKISDYGISRFACPAGLAATTGTAGYRPPEMIRARGKTAYDFSADIYSFGLFLFELATNGQRPFEELDFPVELDNRYLEEAPIPQLTECGCSAWPDMQDSIAQCLQLRPDQRPTASNLVQRFSSSESLCLRQAIPVSMGLSVQALAVRNYRDNKGNERCQVWIGSGSTAGQGSQLSIYDLSERPSPPSGMALSDRLVLCMISVSLNSKPLLVLVGCLSGNIWCYDADKGRQQRPTCIACMKDAIVCMLHYDDSQEVNVIVAGLANGTLAILEVGQLLDASSGNSAQFQVIQLGAEPVMDVCMYKRQLWCACGPRVLVLDMQKRQTVFSWAVTGEKSKISNLAIANDLVWTSVKGSAVIRVWSASDPIGRERGEMDCLDFICAREPLEEEKRIKATDWHVVSLALDGGSLWVGMSSGHILVVDVAKRKAQSVVQRHDRAVRCLAQVKLRSGDKSLSYVLSGAMGYLPRPGMKEAAFRREGVSFQSSDSTYGHLLVWDASLGKMQIRMSADHAKRHSIIPTRRAGAGAGGNGQVHTPLTPKSPSVPERRKSSLFRSLSAYSPRSLMSIASNPSTPKPAKRTSTQNVPLTPSFLALDSEASDGSFDARDSPASPSGGLLFQ
eukprot:scpid2454/ scgid4326/ Leucine-rich repeat serine/threonine-protein kinase 2